MSHDALTLLYKQRDLSG